MRRAFGFALALSLASLPAVRAAHAAGETGEKVVVLVEQMAGIIDDNKKDCDGMGVKLNKFVDDNTEFMKKAQEEAKKKSEAERKEWEAKNKPRMDAAAKKMQEGMMACYKNDKVKGAMEKMSSAWGKERDKPAKK